MSLLTALLAFMPALAAKKAEPEPDLERELAQAREDLARAEDRLSNTRHEVNAVYIENLALRRENNVVLAMVHERDRVIALSAHFAMAAAFAARQSGQANQQRDGFAWARCTCVPGRADALINNISGDA